ncbi:MAG: methyltransferase domain-containing protein [Betaproteobacteria bacterium]|nr:methyltransferase domain-containing protein [Betaproteobacteria bacterium]
MFPDFRRAGARACGSAVAMLLASCSVLPPADVKLDVPYVSTPEEVVAEMLDMAKLGPGDLLYDLGCGDGRIVISAARRFGTRGVGVDIDSRRVADAAAAARSAGVTDRVRFLKQDLFETDFSEASVVTLYLFPELNARLKPKLLALKPGTRIVSHNFGIAGWPPEASSDVEVRGNVHRLFLWTVPQAR